MGDDKTNFNEVSKMFRQRLERELAKEASGENDAPISTRSYGQFKKQYLPKHLSLYEQICNFSEKTLPFKPDKKKAEAIQESINICHLNTTPTGAFSAAFVIPLFFIGIAFLFFFMMPLFVGGSPNFFFIMLSLFIALGMLFVIQQLPSFLANSWRMNASNQMVLATFYIVTYMRHTSNLELAINFAAEHLNPPLSLDLRKVVWDVETQKHDSIKESLDDYLETW